MKDGGLQDGHRELVLESTHIPTSDFRSLIMFEDKSNIEVLQKFVVPKGSNNSMLKCTWTKQFLTIDKRTNINILQTKSNETNFSLINTKGGSSFQDPELKLNEQKYEVGFYERIVTHEGPPHMSIEEKVLSTFVIKEIQEAIDSIVEHLAQQELHLASAVFYFKQDKLDDLVLLFATNIKLERSHLSDISKDKNVVLTIPLSFDQQFDMKLSMKSKKNFKTRPISAKPLENYRSLVSQNRTKHFCPFWEHNVNNDNTYEYTVKAIIELIDYYNQNAENEEIKLSEEISKINLPLKIRAFRVGKPYRPRTKRKLKSVPISIKILYPGMSYATYSSKIKDPIFIYESVKIWSQWYVFIKHIQTCKDIHEYKDTHKGIKYCFNRIIL